MRPLRESALWSVPAPGHSSNHAASQPNGLRFMLLVTRAAHHLQTAYAELLAGAKWIAPFPY